MVSKTDNFQEINITCFLGKGNICMVSVCTPLLFYEGWKVRIVLFIMPFFSFLQVSNKHLFGGSLGWAFAVYQCLLDITKPGYEEKHSDQMKVCIVIKNVWTKIIGN